MPRYKFFFSAMLIVSALLVGASLGFAQSNLKVTGSLPTTPLPPLP